MEMHILNANQISYPILAFYFFGPDFTDVVRLYLIYLRFWISHFVLNIQWQIIIGFNSYILFS